MLQMSRLLQLRVLKKFSTSAVANAKKTVTSDHRKVVNNPGINMRLRAISQSEKGLPINLEDDIDDLEMDMTKADEAFIEHEREIRKQKHVQAMKIVERKYFKQDKEPNMVFWEEKEQIRYLHNNDPEEWTVAKLAESFPVSETGVKKILKAHWNPQDSRKVLKYNEGVKKNWKLLEEGKLDIDERLERHLKKFMSRKLAQLSSSDSHLAINAGLSPSKTSISGKEKTTDSGRVKLEEQSKKIHQEKHMDKNAKSVLPGTYQIGDSHYDSDDGEFLFRVPGMNS